MADPLNKLRKLSSKATPGRWEVRDAIAESGHVLAVVYAEPTDSRQDGVVADTGQFPDSQAKPDAYFIAAAVNYVRSLLAE